MPFKKDGNISFTIKVDGINELIDERTNSILAVREVCWNNKEPRLELRKWIVDENGDKPMKGVSFLTEDGPHNLVHSMTKLGFGNTETIINNIKNRDDFEDSLVKVIGKKKISKAKEETIEISEDDYFDPESLKD